MLAAVLAAGGIDPTIVIGGRLDSLGGTNARLGAGEYLLAEADESDGSFMLLSPTVSMITNIDPEHLDHYGTVEKLEETFLAFANKVPFYGFAVLCMDHPAVQRLIPKVRRRVITYGRARKAEFRAAEIEHDGLETSFTVLRHDEILGRIQLAMPGDHNVLNAVGAVAVAMELQVPFDAIKRALDGFTGVQRRFSVRGESDGVLVIDDYGHHPTEIEVTLEAAAAGFPKQRVIAVFQPHRYSRVQSLWSEFCGAFNGADRVIVCPVYAAGEAPIAGIDHVSICHELRERGHRGAESVDSLEGATAVLSEMARPGDLVITLGAGNVNRVCDELLVALEARG